MKSSIINTIVWLRKPFVNYRIRYSKGCNLLRTIFSYNVTERNIQKALTFLKMNKIEGDYAEFGVFEGSSFTISYHLAQLIGLKNMNFYAFDSFKGIPKLETKEKLNPTWKEGEFSCSLKDFKKNLEKSNVDFNKVKIIEGFYKNSLKKPHNKKEIAFAIIDCDLYSSARDVLNYIKPYLKSGSILLFDDWFAFNGSPERGERRAVKEFLDKNKDIGFVDFPSEGFQKLFVCWKKG